MSRETDNDTAEVGTVSTATLILDGSYELASLFRSVAQISGVPGDELFTMRTVPAHHLGRMLVSGRPLPTAWYRIELPGAHDLRWALQDPSTLNGRRVQYQPYDGATINAVPDWVLPDGVPMRVQGWNVTVAMAMDPETTLATIRRHQQLIRACMAVRGGQCKLDDPSGLLYVAP